MVVRHFPLFSAKDLSQYFLEGSVSELELEKRPSILSLAKSPVYF